MMSARFLRLRGRSAALNLRWLRVDAGVRRSRVADEEKVSVPIKFSTSKASHRTWKVERSMGSRFQRPWWKVLPLSALTVGFLAWCVFREESDIDRALEKHLFEHLPGLLSDVEEDEEPSEEPHDGSK